MSDLTTDEIKDRLAEKLAKPQYNYIKPFSSAADSLIEVVTNVDGRWMFGIQEIDMLVRGVGPGELMYVTGVSHCFDSETQLLTKRGWVGPDEILPTDWVWGINERSGGSGWGKVTDIIRDEYEGPMLSMEGKTHSSLTTPNHRWPITQQYNKKLQIKTSEQLNTSDYLQIGIQAADGPGNWSDAEVEALGWILTDGWFGHHKNSVSICQSLDANPEKCDRITAALEGTGWHFTCYDRPDRSNQRVWSITGEIGYMIRELFPGKRLNVEFLGELTQEQRLLLVEVLRLADGTIAYPGGNNRLMTSYPEVADMYSILLAQAGIPYTVAFRETTGGNILNGREMPPGSQYVFTLGKRLNSRVARLDKSWKDYKGEVWCVTTTLGTVFAKRGKTTYYSGNSGKTQVVLQGLANNPDARVIMFTPDEVDSLILTKLVGITHGVNGEDLERQIKAGSQTAIDMVKRVAGETFKNLVVVDNTLTFEQMSVAVGEATLMWGGLPPQLVIIDFLELLPGDGESDGVQWKSQELKRWCKAEEVPVVCIHQASRSSGKRGQGRGMEGMRYGGENDAIFVLEVYRKAEDKDLEEVERERLKNTCTVDVVKNKRPPSRKGSNDLYLDPDCGRVRSLKPGDLVIERRGADRVLDVMESNLGN